MSLVSPVRDYTTELNHGYGVYQWALTKTMNKITYSIAACSAEATIKWADITKRNNWGIRKHQISLVLCGDNRASCYTGSSEERKPEYPVFIQSTQGRATHQVMPFLQYCQLQQPKTSIVALTNFLDFPEILKMKNDKSEWLTLKWKN